MAANYKLIAIPFLKSEGEAKGTLEAVTFIAASESATHKWRSADAGSFEQEFQRIVSPELAKHALEILRAGKTFEFPNLYELDEIRKGFAGNELGIHGE